MPMERHDSDRYGCLFGARKSNEALEIGVFSAVCLTDDFPDRAQSLFDLIQEVLPPVLAG